MEKQVFQLNKKKELANISCLKKKYLLKLKTSKALAK